MGKTLAFIKGIRNNQMSFRYYLVVLLIRVSGFRELSEVSISKPGDFSILFSFLFFSFLFLLFFFVSFIFLLCEVASNSFQDT